MPSSFTCPRCRAHLKVRDESFVGQTIPCPECHIELLVVKSADGEIQGQELLSPSPSTTTTVSTPSAELPVSPGKPVAGTRKVTLEKAGEQFAPFPMANRTAQVVAWCVAGLCLLLLIPLLMPKSNTQSSNQTESKIPVTDAKPPSSEIPAPAETPNAIVETPTSEKKSPPRLENAEQRLFSIGQWLRAEEQRHGHYPSGTVTESGLPVPQRLGWLAQMAAVQDNPTQIQVSWQHAWNDPLNERFVRRAITAVQNPTLQNKTSEDRYPASHFAGIAGVGADAATLQIDHPRAGIFGENRQTRLSDITDGLTNTMLVAGVETSLGSWAQGTAGYRSFTREPYIHGPDGFGTGQAKSMLVLMADGSVRELAENTDPRIIRRMAAMADGLPLDVNVPGEPGSNPSLMTPAPAVQTGNSNMPPVRPETNPEKMPSEEQGTEKTTAAPPPAPVKPDKVIDIKAALERKLLKFEQRKPAAAFELLLQIEELAGVRIEYDRKKLGVLAQRLDRPISLVRENVTLGELLKEILEKIELSREDGTQSIRIIE